MSITAVDRITEALDTLCISKGMPDVREVRARELADSSFFQNPWFERGYRLTTRDSRIRDQYLGVYSNSQGRRTRFDEAKRVNLGSPKRRT